MNQDLGHAQHVDEIESAAEKQLNIRREINTGMVLESGLKDIPAAAIELLSNTTIVIQTRLGDSLSEFQDGLYFHKCFPALFSNGQGDLQSSRPVKVSVREWLEHKIRFVNPMF